jgi:hypothetical protein
VAISAQLYSDVIIAWLGAAGVSAYIAHIRSHRTRSALERRMLFLLGCIAAVLVPRGFYWLLGWQWVGYLMFFPAVLLPFATLLTGEGLTRRHASLGLKLFVLAGTVVFLGVNLVDALQGNREVLLALLTFQTITIALVGRQVLLARDHGLTQTEIRFNDALMVAAICAIPLIVTDFREELTWIPRRLGATSALIFVYTCIRMTNRTDTRTIVFGEIVTILGRAALVAVCFMAVSGNLMLSALADYFPLALTFVLLFTIFYRLNAISVENRGNSFLQWLARARTGSLEAFLSSLRHLPLAQEHLVLRATDLTGYDLPPIVKLLGDARRMLDLSSLRASAAARGDGEGEAGAEQLVDILEKYGMSHICRASREPLVLLLFNFPMIAGTQFDEIKINLLLKLCRVLQREGDDA